jgi:ribonucleoside-diphosphate reductase alpha chain
MTVLENRYLLRDDNGHIAETPVELFRRVANAVAAAEQTWGTSDEECGQIEDEFYRLMKSGDFLPNSPTLMNAGRRLGMLSACFVLPLEDSIEEIMATARQIALVQSAGGGTGIDLSELRPKGSIVRSSGGTTDGPLSFLKMLSGVTDAIQQGAFRRGANMGVMRIDHPDILALIDVKSDLAELSNYNLSVAITDAFMESLKVSPGEPHVVVNPHTGQSGPLSKDSDDADCDHTAASDGDNRHYTVREVWERIVHRAWQSGDPGLVFIDEVNRHNQTPQLGEIRATNPCGEQPLLPYEACNLGSINLAAFCTPSPADSIAERIDWDRLRGTVELAVRFLDNVVEVNRYPTPEIDEATRGTRKIGLGVMGFADLLFKLEVAYDSDEALSLAERIGSFIREAGWTASERLAAVRGTFPAWKGSVWDTQKGGKPMRNAHVSTIAPTGTISIIAECSSGIEPLFSLAFTRQVLGGKKLVEVNPVFEAAIRDQFTGESEVERIIEFAAAHGSVQALPALPDRLRTVFRTARDVNPEWHVRMQAAWQRYTDAAVSKTVNLPAGASAADVEGAFLLAHELKCKGITVYRDGARPHQPMALTEKPEHAADPMLAGPARPMKLPEVMPSVRLRQPTPFGNMHLHISVDPKTGREREVFAQLGKGGDLANSDLEAICRLVSLFLRVGGDIKTVIDQLEGIGSSL